MKINITKKNIYNSICLPIEEKLFYQIIIQNRGFKINNNDT